MQLGPERFKTNAQAALADRTLKIAIDRTTDTAMRKRAEAVADFPEFDAARQRGRRIKDHVIANLDHYLETFERNAVAAGSRVHWAATADEACRIVIKICRAAGARRATRVKSMLGEEIGLPVALAEAGIERVETDLAEHIIQLAGETPSHIIWPAMHRTKEQISALFKATHRQPHATEDRPGFRGRLDPDVAVPGETGAGRDQLADDHVLLQTHQRVGLAVDRRVGQHPGGLLEEAADSQDSVASEALVMPISTGRPEAGLPPSATTARLGASYCSRSTSSPASSRSSPDSITVTRRSICRMMTSMCLSWIGAPWVAVHSWTSPTRCTCTCR